jgi:hypothetical protein
MMKTSPEIAAALEQFVAVMQAMQDAYHARRYANVPSPIFSVDPAGRKYARIVKTDRNGSSRSVYCFVDLSNGNILKADGWKKPEPMKYRRGNVVERDYLTTCGPHGVVYLTGGGNIQWSQADAQFLGVARDALLEGQTEHACTILAEYIATKAA